MQYGNEVWGGTKKSESIFKLQKRYFSIMTFSSSRMSCRDFYKVTNASIDLCILKCMKSFRVIMEQFKGKPNLYMIITLGTDIF